MGARRRTARRELPGDARRRAAPSTTGAPGNRCGRCARSWACRSSPTSVAAPTRATPGSSRSRSLQIESGGFSSRRAVWWMIFAGVFERHPGLKLVITETPGNWFPPTAAELDAAPRVLRLQARRAAEQGPARAGAAPAERVHGEQRVLRRQLRVALRGRAGGRSTGSSSQLLWGSDYPHLEGTFVYPDGTDDVPSVTRLALRNTFCNVAGGRDRADGRAGTRSTSTTSMPTRFARSPRDRRADPRRARHPDRRHPRRRERHRLPVRRRRLELKHHHTD